MERTLQLLEEELERLKSNPDSTTKSEDEIQREIDGRFFFATILDSF